MEGSRDGCGRSRPSVQRPHVLQPFLDAVTPGYAVSAELRFRDRLPDSESPSGRPQGFVPPPEHVKGACEGGRRSACPSCVFQRRAGETEALTGEPGRSRSADLGVQRRTVSLRRGLGRPAPPEPSGHGPGSAAAGADVLRSVRRPWAAPHTSPERNAFEEHPQGFGLEWPIK